jgi:hypothetical protein
MKTFPNYRVLKAICHKQPESVSDFKARLAQMMRERETGKKFAIVGASRAHECVVRKTKAE